MMHFIDGNQIKLLHSGAEYFPALEQAIQNAVSEVYLQTYIYEHDAAGIRIGNALMQAARRGVSVNVLLDGFGSQRLSKTYIQTLTLAGVEVMFYREKISPWTLKKHRLRRLHRKVAVIDQTIGFVGGINIIDDSNTPDQTPPRIDYAVQIEGDLLPVIASSVHRLWQRLAWMHFRRTNHPKVKQSRRALSRHFARVAFVVRDNVLHRRDIEYAYLDAIQAAQSEILIANAYFIPGRKFRKALLDAARRGVKVKLLLQGRKEYFLMFATHAFYSEFLKNGIEIYEYRKSFMHSKVAVIDHYWATIGSSNIDPFSLLLAFEANIMVQDQTFATELHTDIEHAIQDGAIKISVEEWVKGNILKRFTSWIAYGFVRTFIEFIGQSKE